MDLARGACAANECAVSARPGTRAPCEGATSGSGLLRVAEGAPGLAGVNSALACEWGAEHAGSGGWADGSGWSVTARLAEWALEPTCAMAPGGEVCNFAFQAFGAHGSGNFSVSSRGREFLASVDWTKGAPSANPDAVVGSPAYLAGPGYGFAGGFHGLAQPLDDLVHGRVDFGQIVQGLGTIFDSGSWGRMYDASRLDYMHSLSLALDPYTATAEDLANLATDGGTYWMPDHGAGMLNSSAWLGFAKSFWDGLCAGRAAQEITSLVGLRRRVGRAGLERKPALFAKGWP